MLGQNIKSFIEFLHFSIPMWPLCTVFNISGLKFLGISKLLFLNIKLSITHKSFLKVQYGLIILISSIKFLFSGHPFL